MQDENFPRHRRGAAITPLAAAILWLGAAGAQVPVPDFTLYGKISTAAGAPVTAGAVVARITRGGGAVLDAAATFENADGAVWYLARIPLEAPIGPAGADRPAAREGDALAALLLDGEALELASPAPPLLAGTAARLDAAIGTPPPPPDRFARGDCNGDLGADVSDPVRMLVYLFVNPALPPCLEACDSDGNDAIQVTDPIHLLGYLFLKGPPPPAPGAHCGEDPGSGALDCIQSTCPGA